MVVGTLEVELRLDGCFSLKEKRRVLKSLIDRVRGDFAVAIAEVDDHDLWNRAVIGIAMVTNDASLAESVLDKVTDVLDAHPEVEIVGMLREVERTH